MHWFSTLDIPLSAYVLVADRIERDGSCAGVFQCGAAMVAHEAQHALRATNGLFGMSMWHSEACPLRAARFNPLRANAALDRP